jgi:chemotaxis signal transduction protein
MANNGACKKRYPPLDELIMLIDRQIEGRPHPYASDSFEAFLGSQLGSTRRRGRPCIRFSLQDTHFAFPMQHTLEVAPRTQITPLPFLPCWALGVCNVRGDITSVVNMGRFLDLAGSEAPLGPHLILIRHEEMTIGIIADKIMGIIYDQDPDHRIEKRAPADEALARFTSSVLASGRQEIYLLTVPKLMSALQIC